MIKSVKTKGIYLLAVAILFVFVSLSSTTYSLFIASNEVTDLNYNTGLLDLEITEGEQVVLTNFLPVNDSDGVELKPYTLRIKNVGTLPYMFDLTIASTNEKNTIDSKYIKVKVNDNLPHNLYVTGNRIVTENIIYPNEEKTFKITMWLDAGTPNKELGKTYSAKIIASGAAVYKMLDTSGANHPVMDDDMIPVYYNNSLSKWQIADENNMNSQYEWYNYNNGKWANAVVLKNDGKKIYDIAGKNNLRVDSLKYNNGNVIIDEDYLDIGIKDYNDNEFSEIVRVRFDDMNDNKIFISSNGNVTYYYDTNNKAFILKSGNNTVSSKQYDIALDTWHIVGYSYYRDTVSFYVDGQKISISTMSGDANKDHQSLKFGVGDSLDNVSKITISDILVYNRSLSDNEVSSNYKTTVTPVYSGLMCGYTEFTPLTVKEYYLTQKVGYTINDDDIQRQIVWIPRYKYNVWNVTGEGNKASYDAFNNGIGIVFENNLSSTGTIYCVDEMCTSDELGQVAVNANDNGKYYTHPAFKNGNNDITGFWVSKYEISTDSDSCNDKKTTGCNSRELPVYSKNGNTSWRNNTLVNYYKAINGLDNYGIIKNIEWGAITYLAHSKYGVCVNTDCKTIIGNDTYVSGNKLTDSTTGNIYGVFDMAGGASEYMASGSDTLIYADGGFLLGDATHELLVNDKIWDYNTYDYQKDKSLIIRGGNTTENYLGIYSLGTIDDISSEYITTRFTVK